MKYAASISLIYTALVLTLMEYFFIPPRAEVWLNGSRFSNWPVPSIEAGIVWGVYVMIHFHKPVFECLGATIAGLVLGHLSLKYRSWVGGAILHALVGVTLDTRATIRV